MRASVPLPLRHPGHRNLPDGAWHPVPPEVAGTIRAGHADTPQLAHVMLDRARRRLVILGPFTDHTAARSWNPAEPLGPGIESLVVPLPPPSQVD